MKLLRNRRPNRKGFTLVELLVVILVLAILMAVALPLYLGAVADSQTKTCRANLQTIANAEQAYKTKNTAHIYDLTAADATLTGLMPDLGAMPICPNAGAYTVTDGGTSAGGVNVPAGGIVVTCSIHGNFAPGYDSQ